MPKFCYRFSIGNSGPTGQVGMCFDFTIEQEEANPADAVARCKEEFGQYGAEVALTGLEILPEPFSHVCVYINQNSLTEDDIVSIDEIKPTS